MRRWVYAAWLLGSAVLYVMENNTGTRAVLLASLLLPALSVLAAFLTARRAHAAFSLPASLRPGESARGRIVVSGTRLKDLCLWSGRLEAENTLTGERAMLELEGDLSFRLQSTLCGFLRVQAKALACGDLLGLFAFPVPLPDPRETAAEPVLFPVLAEGGSFREGGWGYAGRESGWDIRDYAPGDPVRSVHWKLSAKRDTLMVRESGRQAEDSLILVLSGLSGALPEDRSAACTGLLSLSAALSREGIPHLAVWGNGEEDRAWMEPDGADAGQGLLRGNEADVDPDSLPEGRILVFGAREDTPVPADRDAVLVLPYPPQTGCAVWLSEENPVLPG